MAITRCGEPAQLQLSKGVLPKGVLRVIAPKGP
jgi:hypothetical protein